ncbi:hypothetical protein H7I76_07000, partial [Mycolicibacterium vaccae]|nr:hypothetical protein [Mycolicibacterium vaccae]
MLAGLRRPARPGLVDASAGPLADTAGLHVTFLALSLPMLALGVVAVFLPALRELDLA